MLRNRLGRALRTKRGFMVYSVFVVGIPFWAFFVALAWERIHAAWFIGLVGVISFVCSFVFGLLMWPSWDNVLNRRGASERLRQ